MKHPTFIIHNDRGYVAAWVAGAALVIGAASTTFAFAVGYFSGALT